MCEKIKNKEKIGWIYIFTNLINKKQYIGQTSRKLNIRIYRHIYDSKKENPKYQIDRAIKKYGIENFQIKKYKCIKNKLDYCERFLIKKLNTLCPNGYNLESGGNKNKCCNEETKRKISIINKGRFIGEKSPRALIKERIEKIKKLIQKKHKNALIGDFFSKYDNKKRRRLFFDILNCGNGHRFNLNIYSFLYRNSWCRKCRYINMKGENHHQALKPEKIKKQIQEKHPNAIIGDYFYKYDKKERGSLFFKIENCGNNHKFELSIHNFRQKKCWCYVCYHKNKKGKNSPNVKIYKITTPNNKIIIIKCLKEFCKKNNNIKYHSLFFSLNNNKKYKGYKIEYSTEEEYQKFKKEGEK